VILLWLAAALAGPLTLDEVLAAVDVRVPEVAVAEAGALRARADASRARAAFDPGWEGDLYRKEGEYPATTGGLDLTAGTWWGPKLSAGYGLGVGEFAAYDGDLETAAAGELRAGIDLPLLRDLGLPESRAKALAADASADAAGRRFDDVRRRAARAAAEAYWSWVEAGRGVEIERELLALATTRDEGLRESVDRGARPRIDALDNARVVAQREARLAEAEARLVARAQSLGLWLRRADGTPAPPSADRLPDPVGPPATPPDVDGAVATALERRPDLAAAERVLDGAEILQRRAQRALLPDLRAGLKVERDLEAGAVPDVAVGVGLRGTLLWRGASADAAIARARVTEQEQTLRGARDAVAAEVVSAHAERVAAAARLDAARRAADISQELLTLEARRVDLGASDLFRLVLREEQLQSALKESAAAEANLGRAEARLRAAIGEGDR
jgi:outer membrane protein TolC